MSNKYSEQGEHQDYSLNGALIGHQLGKWSYIKAYWVEDQWLNTFTSTLSWNPSKGFSKHKYTKHRETEKWQSSKMGAKTLSRPEKKTWILSQQWRKLRRSSICTIDLPRRSEIVSTSYLWKWGGWGVWRSCWKQEVGLNSALRCS